MIVDDFKENNAWVKTRGTFPNSRETRSWATWNEMNRRTSLTSKKWGTYKGCTSSENFKDFQFFAAWSQTQIGSDMNGWNLDKDILVKGNKLYSEDTCIFVPTELNALLTKSGAKRGNLPIGVHLKRGRFYSQVNVGLPAQAYLGYFDTAESAFAAYKLAKEAFIQRQAVKWKGLIDSRAYEALLSYEVEITD